MRLHRIKMPNELIDDIHYICAKWNDLGKLYWDCYQADGRQLWWCDSTGNGGAYSVEEFEFIYELPDNL